MALDWQKSARMALFGVVALIGNPALAQSAPDNPAQEEPVEEKRYYSVEIIVFEYASDVSSGNEVFDPEEPDVPPVPAADFPVFDDMAANALPVQSDDADIEFGDPGEVADEAVTELSPIPSLSDIEFTVLTPDELTMADIYKRLETLDAYRPVLWSGWTQSTHEKELTPVVPLRLLGTPPLHIDGTFTLYLKNYLHLVVDLMREERLAIFQPSYRQEKLARRGDRPYDNHDYSNSDIQTTIYRIQEDRLFKSGQLRYYDHPKFGVLARVNRVETAEEPEETPSPSMLSRAE